MMCKEGCRASIGKGCLGQGSAGFVKLGEW